MHFVAGLFADAQEGLLLARVALEGGHRVELGVDLDAVFEEHVFELADRDGAAAVGVCLFEAVICLLLGDFRICVLEEGVEVVVGDLVLVLSEAHEIHDLFHIQVHLADVKAQLVHYHL